MASLKEMKDCMNEWRTQDSQEVPTTHGLWCGPSKKRMLDSFFWGGMFYFLFFFGGHLRCFLFPNLFRSDIYFCWTHVSFLGLKFKMFSFSQAFSFVLPQNLQDFLGRSCGGFSTFDHFVAV